MNLSKKDHVLSQTQIKRTEFHLASFSYAAKSENCLNHNLYYPESNLKKRISKQSIIEAERIKIGHELHDNVNSILAIAKLYIDIIKTITPKESNAKLLATSYILMAIKNIRQICSDLVISEKDDFSLVEMIGDLVKRIHTTGIFKVHFNTKNKKELEGLSYHQKLNLFRIVQEQLNNTIKYSRSKIVKISLLYNKNKATLIISDNGVGFDTLKNFNGIGLNNIKKRVRTLNGSFEIKSSPGNGCLLHISFPVTS